MAIHAKTNGLLIGGNIIEETENHWVFHAMDNKRPNVVAKGDPKNKCFDGDSAVEDAINWQNDNNPRLGKKK